jgi:hypothetical protein
MAISARPRVTWFGFFGWFPLFAIAVNLSDFPLDRQRDPPYRHAMSGYYGDGNHASIADPKQPLPSTPVECRMYRTWRDDRADELRRQSYGRPMKIVLPRVRIPILRRGDSSTLFA